MKKENPEIIMFPILNPLIYSGNEKPRQEYMEGVKNQTAEFFLSCIKLINI